MIDKIIKGKLRSLTAIHIGSGHTTELTDMTVFRDSKNEILIPGSSIAGALRTVVTELAPHIGATPCVSLSKINKNKFCKCPVCELFGSINLVKDTEDGTASRIWVYDAKLIGKQKTSIRDGVGMDRESNTSSRESQSKFNLEVIPAGSEFQLHLELEKIESGDNLLKSAESILAAALSEWQFGRCFLGGNVSRGLGNFRLEEIEVVSPDLSNTDNFISLLKGIPVLKKEEDYFSVLIKNARDKMISITDSVYTYNSFFQLDFTLHFNDGLIINDSVYSDRSTFDFFPKYENGRFVIPGSSFKGVLRSHAEKIGRTLSTVKFDNKDQFLTSCPACNPSAGVKNPLTSCGNILREYRKNKQISLDEEVEIEQLCLACRFFGNSYLGSRMHISDGLFNKSFPVKMKIMDFLAVDRFTGGGREGAKFDAALLWKPSFKFRIFIKNPQKWELGWLMLVLKDIGEEMLSVGFGQNKWFGKMKLGENELKMGYISGDFAPIGDYFKGLEKKTEGIFEIVKTNLNALKADPEHPVDNWIKEFHQILDNFKRKTDFIPDKDSYYNGIVDKTYEKCNPYNINEE